MLMKIKNKSRSFVKGFDLTLKIRLNQKILVENYSDLCNMF